jgi:hypothetical protein
MRDFHIGDRVTLSGRAFYVRGLSPMSAPRRSIQLEDAETGERIEVPVDEIARALSGPLPGEPSDSPKRRV